MGSQIDKPSNEVEEKLPKERSVKEKDDGTHDLHLKGEEGNTQVDAFDKVAEECDVSQKDSSPLENTERNSHPRRDLLKKQKQQI